MGSSQPAAWEPAIPGVEWEARLAERLASLNYAERFLAAGEAWTEADDEGNPVVHNARSLSPGES